MIICNNIYPKSRACDDFPSPMRQLHLKQPEHAYDSQGHTTSTLSIWCMESSMALLLINMWIGHVTRIKHRDTRLEYRASESKNVKWVERKGLACKTMSRNFRRTCRCSQHHETSYPRRSKMLQQTTDAQLTTTEKESAWSCEVCMHGMAIMMQCNLFKLSGIGILTHILDWSCFTTRQFKCWLACQRQDMGDLHKIKWSGETIFGLSQTLHMLCIKWDAKYHVTTWCEMQTVVWMTYTDSTHFSEQFSYKIGFIFSYHSKDMNLTRFKCLQQFFRKTEKA
jgi:hypothetical protein